MVLKICPGKPKDLSINVCTVLEYISKVPAVQKVSVPAQTIPEFSIFYLVDYFDYNSYIYISKKKKKIGAFGNSRLSLSGKLIEFK